MTPSEVARKLGVTRQCVDIVRHKPTHQGERVRALLADGPDIGPEPPASAAAAVARLGGFTVAALATAIATDPKTLRQRLAAGRPDTVRKVAEAMGIDASRVNATIKEWKAAQTA